MENQFNHHKDSKKIKIYTKEPEDMYLDLKKSIEKMVEHGIHHESEGIGTSVSK